MQNDRFCMTALCVFLHTRRENIASRAMSTIYNCTLIQRKKPTERFVFYFSAILRAVVMQILCIVLTT